MLWLMPFYAAPAADFYRDNEGERVSPISRNVNVRHCVVGIDTLGLEKTVIRNH